MSTEYPTTKIIAVMPAPGWRCMSAWEDLGERGYDTSPLVGWGVTSEGEVVPLVGHGDIVEAFDDIRASNAAYHVYHEEWGESVAREQVEKSLDFHLGLEREKAKMSKKAAEVVDYASILEGIEL